MKIDPHLHQVVASHVEYVAAVALVERQAAGGQDGVLPDRDP